MPWRLGVRSPAWSAFLGRFGPWPRLKLPALFEAKHTTARRTMRDLTRLEHIRELVASRHPTAANARLLLFSACGFDRTLVSHAAARKNVELIDLAL